MTGEAYSPGPSPRNVELGSSRGGCENPPQVPEADSHAGGAELERRTREVAEVVEPIRLRRLLAPVWSLAARELTAELDTWR